MTQATTLTHKEMTAHIRNRIKVVGVKAKVKMAEPQIGDRQIRVACPAYDRPFTDGEQRQIRFIAKVNGLTWVRGLEINVEQMTNPQEMVFYFNQ
jgi:hypothetical protein